VPVAREVRIAPGEQATLVLSLRPRQVVRRLRVDADARAAVSVDGRVVGVTPVVVRARTGSHQVAVRAPGRIPFADHITVPVDQDVGLTVRLAPVRSRAQRAVTWSLLGAGAAAAIGGVVFAALALSDQAAFDDTPSIDIAERGADRARAADVLFVGAAGLVAAGAIHHWLTRPGGSQGELR
jgi:hypothetical protein